MSAVKPCRRHARALKIAGLESKSFREAGKDRTQHLGGGMQWQD